MRYKEMEQRRKRDLPRVEVAAEKHLRAHHHDFNEHVLLPQTNGSFARLMRGLSGH